MEISTCTLNIPIKCGLFSYGNLREATLAYLAGSNEIGSMVDKA